MLRITSTIAAVSTPPGKGGIGIVRISGSDAYEIAEKVFSSRSGRKLHEMKGYTAKFGTVRSSEGKLIDQCVALCFRAPKSYTGEDIVELQCHGGDTVVNAVLRSVIDAGAVPADRGEFTRRAYLNGRIDLTEAEAVMNIINAASEQGEKAAASIAEGALARKTEEIKKEILGIQSQIAAEIDFPEEDVDEADVGELKSGVSTVESELKKLIRSYDVGQKMLRGVPAVIVGSPNVGKSTLLNLITGYDRAIVSSEAGTTRDVLEEKVTIGNTVLDLADTAGIREKASGEIEKIGIDRAKQRLENSSLVLCMFDGSRKLDSDDLAIIDEVSGKTALAIINKNDLRQEIDSEYIRSRFSRCIEISANDGNAVSSVSDAISEMIGTKGIDTDEPILANERQRSCAFRAHDAVQEALKSLEQNITLDVCYALLDEALGALYELTGENASEELIDKVFSDFCVGK